MKAIIKRGFKISFALEGENFPSYGEDEYDEENVGVFNEGDDVEVLRIVDNNSFDEGKAYIIHNPKNDESATVAGSFLELIKE